MIESTFSSQNALSLGQQLKAAREALNLTIEDVSQKTNLKKSHIESIENDIFVLQNVAPTFVRGYVRNYVRFLRLPEELVSSVNYGEVILPKEVINKTSSEKAVQRSQNTWVRYLTIAILLGAIGMTLAWWYQDYQAEQESRDQFVTNATIPVKKPEPVILPAPQPVIQEPASQPVTQEPAPVIEEPKNVVTPIQPMTNNFEVVSSEEIEEQSETKGANALQQVEQEESAQIEQSDSMIETELRIEISGKESWISVKDAKSKRSLAEKLYTNGEVLTFNNSEEYRLTIGAPANVKIYYKGKEVPLKIDGRVARIKLPLAQ